MLVHLLAGFQLNTTEDFGVTAAPERLLHLVYAVNLCYGLNGGGSALVLLAPYEHATKVAIWCGTLKTSKRMVFHIPMRPFLGPKNFSCGKQEIQEYYRGTKIGSCNRLAYSRGTN